MYHHMMKMNSRVYIQDDDKEEQREEGDKNKRENLNLIGNVVKTKQTHTQNTVKQKKHFQKLQK